MLIPFANACLERSGDLRRALAPRTLAQPSLQDAGQLRDLPLPQAMSIKNRDNRAKIAIRACIQKVLLRADRFKTRAPQPRRASRFSSSPANVRESVPWQGRQQSHCVRVVLPLYPKRTQPTLARNDLLIEATLPLSLVWCNIRRVLGPPAIALAPDVVQVALAQG